MGFMDDVKDGASGIVNGAENKLHEMKGQAEGYKQGKEDAQKDMCSCGKDGCTCKANECDC